MQWYQKPLMPDIVIPVNFEFDPFEGCETEQQKALCVLKMHEIWCSFMAPRYKADTGESLESDAIGVDVNRNGRPAVLIECEDALFWQCYDITRTDLIRQGETN